VGSGLLGLSSLTQSGLDTSATLGFSSSYRS
jgi:hypothetical protein